ncbi:MAG: nucleoid-associated protein YgaU [Myxococcota bacterium]|jgi:nucleoid-associated protein YgaU
MLTTAAHTFAAPGIDGHLVKASLETADPQAPHRPSLELQFNPEELEVERFSGGTSATTFGNQSRRWDQAGGVEKESTLKFEVIFDTYEEKPRGSVYRQYIQPLEQMLHGANGKQPLLVFTWGSFTRDTTGAGRMHCKLSSLRVRYTMFLNEGTPVRARVQLELRIGPGLEEQAMASGGGHSADHAKLVTTVRGDTLAAIAGREYDNPGMWRLIADANGLDDPMSVCPGMRLLVPPAL